MRGRGCRLALAIVLWAALGSPAHAARAPEPVVVARDGAVTLVAGDEEGLLCIGVRGPQGSSTACGVDELGAVATTGLGTGTVRYLGIAAPASSASVEVRRAGKLLARAATVAGLAYKGKRAGSLRFALVRLAKDVPGDGLRVHALDGAGTIVAVLVANPAESALLLERRRVLSGRSGRVRWSILSERSSVLAPTVLDLARETVSRCVRVRITAAGSSDDSSSCSSGAPRDVLENGLDHSQAAVADRCSPDFRLLHGVVPASVTRVAALLGDGRRQVARLVTLGDGRHVYGLVIAGGAALRSVTLEQAAGGGRILPRGVPPLSVVCAGGGAGDIAPFGDLFDLLTAPFANLPPVTAVGPVTTLAGSPVVRIADGPAETLCLAVGDQPFTALGCGLVSPSLSDLLGAVDSIEDPRAFALALPTKVATVRIGSADGKTTRSIPTVAGAGYGGPYAGHVRFAAAEVSSYRELERFELLDAAGTVLYREDQSPEDGPGFSPPRPQGAQRVAGRPGAPSLWQTPVRLENETVRCLRLSDGPRPPREERCQTIRSQATVLLSASCVTRRLTVAVAVRAGTRVLVDSGRSAPRPLALRRGAGLLTLPAGRPLRSLTFIRSGRARRVPIDAPPGARQCGWSAVPEIVLR